MEHIPGTDITDGERGFEFPLLQRWQIAVVLILIEILTAFQKQKILLLNKHTLNIY